MTSILSGTGLQAPQIAGNASPLALLRNAIALTDADHVLLSTEYNAPIMEFTGTLTAGRNIIFPTIAGGILFVYNNTTGGFALTFKTAAGTGIAVAAGKRAILYCDGTNVVRVTADT